MPKHVMVEVNTVFQQLTAVLSMIEPAKLNETLGVIAMAFDGRGEKIGQTLSRLRRPTAKLEPSLPTSAMTWRPRRRSCRVC